jgi:hypothetical protein
VTPQDYIYAARVPDRLKPQVFGPWKIDRLNIHTIKGWQLQLKTRIRVGFPSFTLLLRVSWAKLHHREPYEVVMEDSQQELRKHLPIWLRARGNVLVTGLGLGCVVRGLLANRDVDHIHVIEIDPHVRRIVGREFLGNRRVTLQLGDALTADLRGHKFDCAWHDLWTDGDENLQVLHAKLFRKYQSIAERQGAWDFPRYLRRGFSQHFQLLFR